MRTQAGPGGRGWQGQEGHWGPPQGPKQTEGGVNLEKSGQPGLRRSRLPGTMQKIGGRPGADRRVMRPRPVSGGPW
jgi:hypothetical protein